MTLADQMALAAALADFERRYPAYARTAVLDDMRSRDYARLDATGHIYLDYTGGGLYAESQLARHRDLLVGVVCLRVEEPGHRRPAQLTPALLVFEQLVGPAATWERGARI